MGKEENRKSQCALFRAILALDSEEEIELFLADLCTPAELDALSGRWEVARLLDEGVPYRAIYERTGVSTATVTRVARALNHDGSGYREVLERLKRKAK